MSFGIRSETPVNAGVSWDDLRKDMDPLGMGCWVSEEGTFPGLCFSH
jgi:hypothetical protein